MHKNNGAGSTTLVAIDTPTPLVVNYTIIGGDYFEDNGDGSLTYIGETSRSFGIRGTLSIEGQLNRLYIIRLRITPDVGPVNDIAVAALRPITTVDGDRVDARPLNTEYTFNLDDTIQYYIEKDQVSSNDPTALDDLNLIIRL